MVGYEHGETYYQLYDNGTMFLGKPSTAQIAFNGTDGYIENAGYKNGTGARINFSGATTTTAAGMGDPYIHLKKNGGGEVLINTGDGPQGIGTSSNGDHRYFVVRGSGTTAPNRQPTDLIYIGDDAYHLRTENFVWTSSTATDNHGFKLDLKNGKLESYDNLQIIGGANSKIHFGNTTDYLELGTKQSNGVVNGGYLNSTAALDINGAAGSKIHFGDTSTYLEVGHDGNTGYMASTGSIKMTAGTINPDSFQNPYKTTTEMVVAPNNAYLYLSTQNLGDVRDSGGTNRPTLVGNRSHTNWRLIVGPKFGVTDDGELTAKNAYFDSATLTNASVTGTITTNNLTATGGDINGLNISGALTLGGSTVNKYSLGLVTGIESVTLSGT